MAWTRIVALSELGEGVQPSEVDGEPVALYRIGNEVFATHGICTHAFAYLADGYVEEGTIECPVHQGVFDIRTGRALCPPLTEDLPTYAVKLEDGDVYVDITRSAHAG